MSEQQTWFERQGYDGFEDWLLPVGDDWAFVKFVIRILSIIVGAMLLFGLVVTLIEWQPWVFAPLALYVVFRVVRWALLSPHKRIR